MVWPGAKGEPPAYKVTPESAFYTVVNEAASNDPSAGKLTVLRDWLEDSNTIRIRGNCTKRYKESLNMYKSADFFLAMLVVLKEREDFLWQTELVSTLVELM